MSQLYVIGHVNPDTDAIASAMGYAWLLKERDGEDTVAARAGPLNPQTTWVLKRLGLDSPELLTDASPRFETIARHLDTTSPDSPLMEAWSIANRTWGVAPVIKENSYPYGLVTGPSMFTFLNHLVGLHPRRQEMRIADILELPCREATDTNVPAFQAGSRIRDAINRILRQEGDDFWVVDENGVYVGICRQRDVLNPPRLRLVLVDHNEPGQALGSLEEAELIEILDHHRLGNTSTHVPIRFTVDVVGSTSTLVSERIEEAGLSATPEIAGLLLAGLLSDTLLLTSPTTTERDWRASERLGRWAFISSAQLAGEKIESYGQQILQAGSGISARDPDEVVGMDMKLYEAGGYHFAISQVEVTDLLQLEDHLQELSQALEDLRDHRGLNFAMLMVTDVVRGFSHLLIKDEIPPLVDLPYQRKSNGIREAEGVVSRKKQLLPTILSLLEE
jgi:manganese-dependent inorganic pyrophosphatase